MPPHRCQRPKRLLFGLLFFEDLPASEVFREDQFVDIEGLNLNLINTFQTVKAVDVTGELPKNVLGKILDIGTKTRLEALRVNTLGVIANEDTVPTSRKRAVAKKSAAARHARETHLDGLNQALLTGGPKSLPLLPGKPRKKKLSSPQAEMLKLQLQNLSCFQPGEYELSTGEGVYISKLQAHTLLLYFSKNPCGMFRELLRYLIPHEVMIQPGLSAYGEAGYVQVPPKLVTLAAAYARKNAKGNKTFDPVSSLANLLFEERVTKPKRTSTASSTVTISDDAETVQLGDGARSEGVQAGHLLAVQQQGGGFQDQEGGGIQQHTGGLQPDVGLQIGGGLQDDVGLQIGGGLQSQIQLVENNCLLLDSGNTVANWTSGEAGGEISWSNIIRSSTDL